MNILRREHSHTPAPARGRFGRAGSRGRSLLVESVAPPSVQSRDKLFRRTLIVADVLAGLMAVWFVTAIFGDLGPGRYALLLPAVIPFVNTASGLYRRDELVLSKNTLDETPAVFQASTISVIAAYLVQSWLIATPLGAQVIAVALASLTALTLLLRLGGRSLAFALAAPERCLVVGGTDAARRFESKLSTGRSVKAQFVGRLPFEPPRRAAEPARQGSLWDFRQAVRKLRVHRVIIEGDGAPPETVHEAIQSAKAVGVKVSLLPRMFEIVGSSVAFDYIGGLTVLGLRRFGLSRRAWFVKRGFDLVGSSLILALLSPFLLLIAIAIRLESRGLTLFRQTRVGRHGDHFEMLKFRSMVPDAEARKRDLQALNEADGLFKIAKDPRVTRVGRLLRRTSLDELPQLINVLRGEMSLVGPRPLVVDEDEQIRGWHRRRLHLTPGMTGPWQVLGGAIIPLREMVAIDYLYVANWSLWDDIKILLRTVPCVVGARGR